MKENIEEARYHKCHICDVILLCDNNIISKHVYHTHGIKLSQYNSDFVLKNGSIVFPTYQDYCQNKKVFDLTNSHVEEPTTQPNQDNGLISQDMISSESEDSDEEG